MRISYEDLGFGDLRGNLVSDYLIAVDAHLTIDDGGRVILDEPFFPVVEFARSLESWLNVTPRGGFEFESMSAEELGIVTIARERDGWRVYSSCTPDVHSSVITWAEVEASVRDFANKVRTDLNERDIDAARILGPTAHSRED